MHEVGCDSRMAKNRGAPHELWHSEAERSSCAEGKRIALVSLGRGPGDARAMYKEARSLASWGYQVTYVCNAASGPMVTDAHVHVVAVKMPAGRVARQIGGPSIVLREALCSRPDVVHVFDPALIGPALRLGRRYGLKIVIDLPEDNAKQILQKSYLGPMAARKLVSCAYKSMSQRWLLQADLVIAATPSIAESLPDGCEHVVVRNYPKTAEIDAVLPRESTVIRGSTPVLRWGHKPHSRHTAVGPCSGHAARSGRATLGRSGVRRSVLGRAPIHDRVGVLSLPRMAGLAGLNRIDKDV
jgi:hypothetical protein